MDDNLLIVHLIYYEVFVLCSKIGRGLNTNVIILFQDIPISQDTFMFQNLEPNKNYSVALTMRNADGEGPATSCFITTLLEPEGMHFLRKIIIIH